MRDFFARRSTFFCADGKRSLPKFEPQVSPSWRVIPETFTRSCSWWQGSFSFAATAQAQEAKFVGSASCAQCHKAEHKDWLGSHHAVAMQAANDQTRSGPLRRRHIRKNGVKSSFFKKDGKFRVRTDGPDGKLADFDIAYTFGVAPLQQYLIALPNGRLQALGDRLDARPAAEGGQRWYHLYPDRKLGPGDPLHWTGIDQNWNYQCAWCHSTNLQKNRHPSDRRFPHHLVGDQCWMRGLSWPCFKSSRLGEGPRRQICRDAGPRLPLSSRRTQQGGLDDQRCGTACPFSRRAPPPRRSRFARAAMRGEQFAADPAEVGKLFDAFRPSTLASGLLLYPDGQQRDEVYNYASFLQSKMHAAGVTCSRLPQSPFRKAEARWQRRLQPVPQPGAL